MAKETIQNGQAEHGTRHVMEEQMRAAEQGVFEEHSSEAARRPRKAALAAKDAGAAPENKTTRRTKARK